MPTWIYSQSNLTKEQQKRLLKIATPTTLQQWADNKLRVKELDSIIKVREYLLDSLTTECNKKLNALELEYNKALSKISSASSNISDTSSKLDDILTKKLKTTTKASLWIEATDNLKYIRSPTISINGQIKFKKFIALKISASDKAYFGSIKLMLIE